MKFPNKFFLIIYFAFTLLISFAQEANSDKPNSTKSTNINIPNSTQTVNDKIEFKNNAGTSIITITDEGGNAGSITIPSATKPLTGYKLYNDGGTLKFNGITLGGGGASSITELSDAIYDGSSLFLGYGSGVVDDGTANYNTAVGFYSLNKNNPGHHNTAVGHNSMQSNEDGYWNSAFGFGALGGNISGTNNTAVGMNALGTNTSHGNVGIGLRANYYNQNGQYNTAVGTSAGGNITTAHTSHYNVFVGAEAGYNATGSSNIFIGRRSGYNETTSNKLYIENSDIDTPLIWGDFQNDDVQINGDLHVTGNITSDGTTTDLAIGDSYQGGKIFWLDATGKHGLIVAASDQSAGINWSSNNTSLTAATGNGIGAGEINTLLIITENRAGTSAAKLCSDLSIADGSVLYGDWYLPSLDELRLLFEQKTAVGGTLNNIYWSSQEATSTTARTANLTVGTYTGTYPKTTSIRVRAIRKF